MSPTSSTRRRIVRSATVAVIALVVVGGGAVAVSARNHGDGASGYRTATVAERTVQQALSSVGTIEPVRQASVAFPTAGTVTTVDVGVGDTVAVGDTLATLDTDSLQRDLTDAKATLAAAELTLHQAVNGETITGSGGNGPSGALPAAYTSDDVTYSYADLSTDEVKFSLAGSATVTGPGPTTTTTPATAADVALAAAQQAVLDAQKQVDTDLAIARADLDAAIAACSSTTTEPPATDPPATDPTTTTTTTLPVGDGSQACTDALQKVLADQQAVAADQAALAKASTTLNDLISARLAQGGTQPTVPSGGGSGGPNTGSIPSSSGGSLPSGTSPSPSASGTTPTGSSPSAEQLVAYQSAVDAAAAKVAVAEQAVARATIVSPIAGTVSSVAIAAGDEVTAASSTQAIIVTGSGGYEVTTNVSVDDLNDLKVGQSAEVVPDGTDVELDAKIVAIGIAPTSSTSSTTYPVTLGFTGARTGLRNGLTAAVTIVIDQTNAVLAVPTSALSETGGRHTVKVLADGAVTTVQVGVGAKGGIYTAVTSGLKAGQQVVLADLSEPLPTSATSSSNGTRSNRGGNGPVQFTPGAFPGGGGQRPGG